jgi:myo-inositol 2-dehydrogenase/D-chiro-inositol 1-dehydrogenase
MIKMALFGCGRIGRLHAQNISQNQGAELVQVYDVHQLSADQLATRHNCEVALSVEVILAINGYSRRFNRSISQSRQSDFL